MPFAYYTNLTARDKAIYRQSDSIEKVTLANPVLARPFVTQIEEGLIGANRRVVQSASQGLLDAVIQDLGAPDVRAKVLNARPSKDWGELQGLYEPEEDGELALITVWMRTAAHKRVVAFKTFLRTVLHELCHHLDYEHFMLEDSFHTEGFFKRESSLFHQIVAGEAPETRDGRPTSPL